jgi:hypothetical protein
VGGPLFVLSLIVCELAIGRRTGWLVPDWARQFHGSAAPFLSVNSYGLFAVMTTERNEIIVEVSSDGSTWHELEFRWKPGRLDRAPAFVAPHQPRLDWQMWFAALHPGFIPQRDMSDPRMNWFGGFLSALLQHKQPVWNLLEPPPIPIDDVRFVRCRFYRYRFTNIAERRATGAWWKREFLGAYSDSFGKQ